MLKSTLHQTSRYMVLHRLLLRESVLQCIAVKEWRREESLLNIYVV